METATLMRKGVSCNTPTQLLVFGYVRWISYAFKHDHDINHIIDVPDLVSFITIGYYFQNDFLEFDNNKTIQKLLSKIATNYNSAQKERVKLSIQLTKINRKGKENIRTLLFTDKAIYNFKPNALKTFQKRILIKEIEFVHVHSVHSVHSYSLVIQTSHDRECCTHFWNYKSFYNQHIASVLADLYQLVTNKSLPIYVDEKQKALCLTRRQRFRRYFDLVCHTNWSDEVHYSLHAKITKYHYCVEKATFDDFEFVALVGVTNYGKIIKLKKKSNNEIFTAKIVRKQCDESVFNISTSTCMNHAFLPQLAVLFETEEKIYYIYKYDRAQYQELFYYLQNGKTLTEPQARFYGAAIVSVLAYLHSLGVIYKELKTENILIDKSGNICLNLFEEMYADCPEYLAPEIILNLHNLHYTYDKSVDWWCLGILLYEITVGVTPFYHSNLDELYTQIKQTEVQFPPLAPHISHSNKDLIIKLLNKNPKKRLGCSDKDVAEIQNHPFFQDINFGTLINGEIKPPYKPNVDEVIGTQFIPLVYGQRPKKLT